MGINLKNSLRVAVTWRSKSGKQRGARGRAESRSAADRGQPPLVRLAFRSDGPADGAGRRARITAARSSIAGKYRAKKTDHDSRDTESIARLRLYRTQGALWTVASLEQRRRQSLRRHAGAHPRIPPGIEQMLGKDLTDATWEMKRYSRHKALVVERQIHEQQEMEEVEEAEEAEQLEESAEESEQAKQADKPGVEGEQIEQAEDVKQAGAPTTQFERMLELAAVVDSALDCDDIIAGPVDELEYAAALQSSIQYYERLDRLYSVAMARREDVLKQLDLYRQGLGRHLRRVSDDIIEGEFSQTQQEAPSITGPDAGAQ